MTLFQLERASLSYCRLILIMGVSCFIVIDLLGLYFGEVIGTRSLTNDVGWATLGHDLEQSISGRTTRSQLEEIFKNVNKIRPIGSPEHEQVRQYIQTYLSARNWTVELDSFTEDTVIGEKTFHNIIADIGTPKPRRLILACHYESLSKEGFYGSIDSAMPCSIILKLADILSVALLRQRNFDVGLQLVFFDGEEAFVDWSDTDSIYGARHLAKKWSETPTPVGDETLLSSIDLLILLDLLGSRVGGIPNYKLAPDEYYDKLFECEQSMRSHRLLRSTASRGETYFGHTAYGVIQDDHIPFMKKDVKVLHLIPQQFPSFWHTTGDNDSIIDWKVSLDKLNVIEAYVRSYLHLIE